ncbi:hypothetical protein MKX07_008881 [Trichoderma sp. CBMAI-0711]|nr:hypothetical protein MKX07_008881 [Trichoderma sp. CBMAI-0711]
MSLLLRMLREACRTNDIRVQWIDAVERGFLNQQENEVLVVLLGLKKDVRGECADETHRVTLLPGHPAETTVPNCCVMPQEVRRPLTIADTQPDKLTWRFWQGLFMSRHLRCWGYAECSAATGEGMDSLFERAGQEATRRAIEAARRQQQMPTQRRLFYPQWPVPSSGM